MEDPTLAGSPERPADRAGNEWTPLNISGYVLTTGLAGIRA
jgi:hypothetical protein